MALGLVKIGIGVAVLALGSIGFRLATTHVNDDARNYEVTFELLPNWKELPHNPNTLLLMRNPKNNALLRCSATQVVDDQNPEPDMDTDNTIKRVVQSARENQSEMWQTDMRKPYDNGRVKFGLFTKSNPGKAIIIAMAVRGNTTMVASMSNSGDGAKAIMEGRMDEFFHFLDSINMTVTDKWIKMHARYE